METHEEQHAFPCSKRNRIALARNETETLYMQERLESIWRRVTAQIRRKRVFGKVEVLLAVIAAVSCLWELISASFPAFLVFLAAGTLEIILSLAVDKELPAGSLVFLIPSVATDMFAPVGRHPLSLSQIVALALLGMILAPFFFSAVFAFIADIRDRWSPCNVLSDEDSELFLLEKPQAQSYIGILRAHGEIRPLYNEERGLLMKLPEKQGQRENTEGQTLADGYLARFLVDSAE